MTQLRAEAIVPKFGGSISMMCSMFIIRECILDHKAGKGSAVQRALVGMSVFDVMGSFAWFLSTWAVPKSNSTPFSAGNAATCNFQGFLLQFVIGVSIAWGARRALEVYMGFYWVSYIRVIIANNNDNPQNHSIFLFPGTSLQLFTSTLLRFDDRI